MNGFAALLARAWAGWRRNRGASMSAALAFYTLLSAAPLALFLGLITRAAMGGDRFESLRRGLTPVFGVDVVDALLPLVERADEDPSRWTTLLGVGIILYASTRVFWVLRRTMLAIWDDPPPDDRRDRFLEVLRHRSIDVLMIVALTAMWFAGLVGGVALESAEAIVGESAPVSLTLLELAGTAFSFVVLASASALVYRTFPRRRPRWRNAWIGATATAAAIVGGEHVVSWIVGRLALLTLYGAAGSVVLVLIWFRLLWTFFLAGAELTRALEIQGRDGAGGSGGAA